MKTRFLGAAICSIGFLLAACGDSGTSSGGIDCSTVTPKGYSELSGAFSKCTTCHDSALTSPTDRQSAPSDVNYDTYEAASAQADKIVEQLDQGLMPPSDQPQLTDTEKTDLLNWASCGTPQ
ncbi:MAG TPA: hypothetical protein VL400_10150 [Polyangiaceae bacterium]|nr:hypothetical protein [Polyangiaceae bacterium]